MVIHEPLVKIFFLFIIIVPLTAFIFFRFRNKLSYYKRRKTETMEDIYKRFSFKNPFDFQLFTKIIRLVAKSYGINPGKIRPNDEFKGNLLKKLDNWSIESGGEILQEHLEKEFSIMISKDANIRTIQDLMDYCQRYIKKKGL